MSFKTVINYIKTMSDKKASSHKEWAVENSLTSPSDRDPARTYKPNQGHPNLTEEEVQLAMNTNNNTDFVNKFPAVERRYADPVEPMQRIGLVSWVPAKGAIPNAKGIYGMVKLRGNYATPTEANERAEYIIRNVDSYHQIYHAYVGRPFPCTVSSDFSAETSEVDIRKSVVESVSNNIKSKKEEERKTIQEIEDREKMLVEESKREEADPFEYYTTLRVKKAQISWTYLETEKKLKEMKNILINTSGEIDTMNSENSEYSEKYFGKYMEARKQSGLSLATNQDNFMKFLVEDADFDFL